MNFATRPSRIAHRAHDIFRKSRASQHAQRPRVDHLDDGIEQPLDQDATIDDQDAVVGEGHEFGGGEQLARPSSFTSKRSQPNAIGIGHCT